MSKIRVEMKLSKYFIGLYTQSIYRFVNIEHEIV